MFAAIKNRRINGSGVDEVLFKLFFAQYQGPFAIRQFFQRRDASRLILLPTQVAVIPELARLRSRAAWLLPRILTGRF
jgi:hypothetical protein